MQFEDLKLFWKILNDFSCGFREIFQRKSGIMNKMKMVSFKLYFFVFKIFKLSNFPQFLSILNENVCNSIVISLGLLYGIAQKSDFRLKFMVYEKKFSLKMKRKLFQIRGQKGLPWSNLRIGKTHQIVPNYHFS